jgi:hypothetical protein
VLTSQDAHAATEAVRVSAASTARAQASFGGQDETPVVYDINLVAQAAAQFVKDEEAEGRHIPPAAARPPRMPVLRAEDGTTLVPLKLFELWEAWQASHPGPCDPAAFGVAARALVQRETARAAEPAWFTKQGEPRTSARDFWCMERMYLATKV